MGRVLAPALLQPAVQAVVLAVFVGVVILSLASLPRLSKYGPATLHTALLSVSSPLLRTLPLADSI